jgi:hypothetical protein
VTVARAARATRLLVTTRRLATVLPAARATGLVLTASRPATVVPAARAIVVLLAVLVLLVVAGCGGGDDAPQRRAATPTAPIHRADGDRTAPSDADLLRALMRDRAAALEAGDVDAYAGTSVARQRTRDRRAARRANRIRLRDVSLTPDVIDHTDNRARVRVHEDYSIAGVRSSFRTTQRYVAVRTGAGWRIRAVRGARGLPPWEVGVFAERRTRHFVVLAPPSVPVGEVVPALEAGYERIHDVLSRGDLRRRYLVVVARDATQARALTATIQGVETLTAIADAAIREEGPARAVAKVVSLRLLVDWGHFAALDPDGQRRVVTHELTHSALAGTTSGRTPAWLIEGAALYVSEDRRLAPPEPVLRSLSKPNSISRLMGDAQAYAYAASSAAAFAIVDRYGRGRLFALYDAFNDPRLRGRPGRGLANRALHRELGIGIADLEAMLH